MDEKYELLREAEENMSDLSLTLLEAKDILNDTKAHIEAEKDQKQKLQKIIEMQKDMSVKVSDKLKRIIENEDRHHKTLNRMARKIQNEHNLQQLWRGMLGLSIG